MWIYHDDADIFADAMRMNDVPFLVLASEHAHYGTVSDVDNLEWNTLEIELKN